MGTQNDGPMGLVKGISFRIWLFGGFLKCWYPQIIHFNRVFHYKPSILGYPYFWKHPFKDVQFQTGQDYRISPPKIPLTEAVLQGAWGTYRALGSAKWAAWRVVGPTNAAFPSLRPGSWQCNQDTQKKK